MGFWINLGVERNMAPNSSQWITPFALQLIPAGLLIIGLLFIPESPRWMAKAHGRSRATETLAHLRDLPVEHPAIIDEVDDILQQLQIECSDSLGNTRAAWKEIMQPGLRNRVLLGVLIMIFFQMAGSNAINYYSPRIFHSIGLRGTSTPLVSTGVYGIVRLVAVFLAMYFVVDRFGRKSMLICGSVMMVSHEHDMFGFYEYQAYVGQAISMWLIGVFVKIQSTESKSDGSLSASSYAAAVFIFVFAVSFCFSWAGVPWVICSEIYPLRVRGLCVSICVATHWLFNFVIARSTPYMISNITYGTYFVFAACTTLSIPFIWFMLPETKGLKLEDVDALFEDGAILHNKRKDLVQRRELIEDKAIVEQIESV
jgi:sugar porter (SP) family MFS transporter